MSENTVEPKDTFAIVGLGGSGGWTLQMLLKSPQQGNIVLVDGDKWEDKNLDRCLVDSRYVGRPKTSSAEALLVKGGWGGRVQAIPEYLSSSGAAWDALVGVQTRLRLFACVDNHVARRACLELADTRYEQHGLDTVVALPANEIKSAAADVYLPTWRYTPLDPRIRYPEIMTDNGNDPLSPSCTGELAESAPQLALSNGLAAFSAMYLMRTWAEEEPARRESEFYPQLQAKLAVSIQWNALTAAVLTKADITARGQD